jgi:hypothetical protein
MSNSSSLREQPRSTALHQAAHALEILAKPEAVAILLIAVLAAFRVHGTVDPDVSWQLWIADRVHHGARLYRDIVEVNPPLWFWMALPMDRIAQLLGVRSDIVTIVAIAIVAALSLLASGRLISDVSDRRRALLLAYAALILFEMPWMHIGQREQIALLGAVPYAALIAARRSGRPVPCWLALMVGAGAALGFSLKHYFLLVPALLELWLYVGTRRSWRLLRPEILVTAATGAAYACAMLIWAPDFFTLMLPLIVLAYGTTGAPHFVQVFQPPIWIAFVILGFISIHYRRMGERAPLATALLIAGIGFGAAYLIQAKGWLYHSIPLVGCVSISLAALLAETDEPPASLRLIGPALLALPIAVTVQETRAEVLPTPELVRSVADLAPGTSVGFLATDPALAWSVTYQHHLRYASRYYAFWMLGAVLRNEQQPKPERGLLQLHRDIIHQTVIDFECAQPRRIIVSRPAPDGSDKRDFDILPFFLKDPEFARLFAHYRPIGRGEGLDPYDLAAPLDHPPPGSCRRGV